MFQTNILSNAAKHYNLKTLLSKIIIFKKTCACYREKSEIVSLSTFDQCDLFNNPEWFGHQTREHIPFCKDLMKKQLKLMVAKKVADRSHFGSNI